MKFALLGSLGSINRYLIPSLIQAGHEVTIVSTQADRATDIQALGGIPAIGTMTDADFLAETFKGKDAVYLMISGAPSPDLFAAIQQQAEIFKTAIEKSGVSRVVQLSSIGADAGPEAGSLYAYHLLENHLRQLNLPVAFVRPTGFYANWFAHLDTLRAEHAIYANIPMLTSEYWTAPEDIAAIIQPLLEKTPVGHTVHYAMSDYFNGADFIDALAKETGWHDLHYVEITDAQYQENLKAHGVPDPIIQAFLQMNDYQRHPEALYKDLRQHGVTTGKPLAEFIKEYAAILINDETQRANTIVS
ncbi:short-chain dehydrogenase [Enterococcus canis]|uniref:Short-chain dehydrogenase n=1 Tax=Enterococcus canis TaxID=214095 RepID=A0A1L8RJL8_9ENTE|nr:NAD(P)H-binding protein [Enterococcus canis]OJG19938.1 short-chain dehydrogenase [Enterococcus canis]